MFAGRELARFGVVSVLAQPMGHQRAHSCRTLAVVLPARGSFSLPVPVCAYNPKSQQYYNLPHRLSNMKHWTQSDESSADSAAKAAETFAEFFVVENNDGSILRGDLYLAYSRWAVEHDHETVPERQFLEIVTEQVDYRTTATTKDLEWVQQFDGLGLSLVDAF
ncbi:hypothetical protein [Halococcus thailandensis]|nr:hypothetical protein [Halococcus thailandensis]